MEEIIFNLIANAGNAKSLVYEAIGEAEKGNFDRSEELLKEANESLLLAHHTQTELITKEINGDKVEVSLLLVHAEDHLSAAFEIKNLAEYIIRIYKKIG